MMRDLKHNDETDFDHHIDCLGGHDRDTVCKTAISGTRILAPEHGTCIRDPFHRWACRDEDGALWMLDSRMLLESETEKPAPTATSDEVASGLSRAAIMLEQKQHELDGVRENLKNARDELGEMRDLDDRLREEIGCLKAELQQKTIVYDILSNYVIGVDEALRRAQRPPHQPWALRVLRAVGAAFRRCRCSRCVESRSGRR